MTSVKKRSPEYQEERRRRAKVRKHERAIRFDERIKMKKKLSKIGGCGMYCHCNDEFW